MAARSEFSLVGMKPIADKLKKLTQELSFKASRAAMREAFRPVAKAARQNAAAVDSPFTARKIRDNVRLQFATRFYRETGLLMYRVGVASKRGPIPRGNPDEGKGGNTPHWHLLEIGTEKMRAQPMLRPALANNVGVVLDKLATGLEEQINKIVTGL